MVLRSTILLLPAMSKLNVTLNLGRQNQHEIKMPYKGQSDYVEVA